MDLKPFTRGIEECRRRWNRRTLKYVTSVARIVRRARAAVNNERRWCRWIHQDLKMDRSTVHRYLKIEAFLRANVDLNQHFDAMTISKLHILARLPRDKSRHLVSSGLALRMNDLRFLAMGRRLIPRRPMAASLANLTRSTDAAIRRLERSLDRWKDLSVRIPAPLMARLKVRLVAMGRTFERIERSAAAM